MKKIAVNAKHLLVKKYAEVPFSLHTEIKRRNLTSSNSGHVDKALIYYRFPAQHAWPQCDAD